MSVVSMNISERFFLLFPFELKSQISRYQQALCAPSRNSLLTSRRPDTLHLYDFYNYWRDTTGNFTTLPQYFKAHGYDTYAIGKIFHPGRSSNFSDDFPYSWTNRTFHPSSEAYMNAAVCYDASMTPHRNLNCPVDVMTQPEGTLPDIQSVRETKRILSLQTQRPFFVAVGLHKPHIPFRFPSKYLAFHENLRKFDGVDFETLPSEMPTVAFNPYNDIRNRDDVRRTNISYPFGPIAKHFGWKIRQGYYASVTYIDDLIGQILDGINMTNTIVVLTGDHGWSLGEHGEWAKYSNYEVAVRVPLLIYSPLLNKQNRTRYVSTIVELLDLFPTLVDLASLPSIEKCRKSFTHHNLACTEGKSLFNHFVRTAADNGDDHRSENEKQQNYEYAISQYPRPGTFPTKHPDSDRPRLQQIRIMGYSLRTNNYRYTIWIGFNRKTFKRCKYTTAPRFIFPIERQQIEITKFIFFLYTRITVWSRIHGEELYDHTIDPHELINLATRDRFDKLKLHLMNKLKEKLGDTPTQQHIIRIRNK